MDLEGEVRALNARLGRLEILYDWAWWLNLPFYRRWWYKLRGFRTPKPARWYED